MQNFGLQHWAKFSSRVNKALRDEWILDIILTRMYSSRMHTARSLTDRGFHHGTSLHGTPFYGPPAKDSITCLERHPPKDGPLLPSVYRQTPLETLPSATSFAGGNRHNVTAKQTWWRHVLTRPYRSCCWFGPSRSLDRWTDWPRPWPTCALPSC